MPFSVGLMLTWFGQRMPSINLDLEYFSHLKTRRLVGLLGRGAEVIPIRVWCFCGRHYSETGRLTGLAAQEIEQEVMWWGKPGVAVAALLKVGFLDLDGECYVVHDWLEHCGHIARYKERAKKAAQERWRKGGDALDATSNATSNAWGNASALPCKEGCISSKSEKSQKARAAARDFAPGSAEDLAARFEFLQRGRKENARDIADEIRSKVEAGWSLARFAAEIEAKRELSERWHELVIRLKGERKPSGRPKQDLMAGLREFAEGDA